MLFWLKENAGTILVTLALAGLVFGVVRSMRRDRKRGTSSCGGDCAHCAGCGVK